MFSMFVFACELVASKKMETIVDGIIDTDVHMLSREITTPEKQIGLAINSETENNKRQTTTT